MSKNRKRNGGRKLPGGGKQIADSQPVDSQAEMFAALPPVDTPTKWVDYPVDTPTKVDPGVLSQAGSTPLGRENEERMIVHGHGAATASGVNVEGDRVAWDEMADVMKKAGPPRGHTTGERLARLDTPTYTQAGTSWPGDGVPPPPKPCHLCGEPMHPWTTLDGEVQWGNNARPLGLPGARCCDKCNAEKVLPARLERPVGRPGTRPTGEGKAPPDGRVVEVVTSAPTMRSAIDVAELRSWMVRQWQPGGVFAKAASLARDLGVPWSLKETATPGKHIAGNVLDDASTERRGLQRAALYYVEAPMVDLIATVAPSTPPDVRLSDLILPAPEGLAVFAKPIVGLTIQQSAVEVWAVCWQPANIHGPNGERLPSLAISSYRRVDFDEGLDAQTMSDPAVIAQMAQATDEAPRVKTTNLIHGQGWLPLGRSDWPIAHRADECPFWAQNDDALWNSYADDRRTIAAIFTLLAEEGVSNRVITRAPRPAARRAHRSGITAPSDIVVVTLRRPRIEAPEGTPVEEGDGTGHVPRTHRWLVREHMRWQPVGTGRQQRRLTTVRAHIKGPEGAPLIIKTKINRWVR